jgi:hypothetical protein|tara:strand:- start:80 stop:277 length:198 start_codon:yes stop_codon:yes gene_type:complete
MKTAIGGTLVIVGLMIAAGSAGDCDGRCMEQANTMGEMMIIMMIGLATSAIGAVALLSAADREEA